MFCSSIFCTYFIYFNIFLYGYMITDFKHHVSCHVNKNVVRYTVAVLTFWLKQLSGQHRNINTEATDSFGGDNITIMASCDIVRGKII